MYTAYLIVYMIKYRQCFQLESEDDKKSAQGQLDDYEVNILFYLYTIINLVTLLGQGVRSSRTAKTSEA